MGVLLFVAYDIYIQELLDMNWLFYLMLFALVYMTYAQTKEIFDIISTKFILYDDHFEFKSRKNNVQMKYDQIASIKMKMGSARIKDIYGNRIPLDDLCVRNIKELTSSIMDKAVNAEKPEDVSNIGTSKYLFYCTSCQKEYYIKGPTGVCPKCSKKYLQLDYNLSFQLVKNEKLNEKLMFVFWTIIAICIVLLIIYVTYWFSYRK